jgi:hypothetical protein
VEYALYGFVIRIWKLRPDSGAHTLTDLVKELARCGEFLRWGHPPRRTDSIAVNLVAQLPRWC